MAKKRRKQRPDTDAGDFDHLGELISRHQVTLVGVLIVSAVVSVIGVGLVTFALTRDPISLTFLLVGSGVLLVAVALLVTNVFNVGRRLELRKKGIRLVERGYDLEMFWEDIADIHVSRVDETNYGVATVRKRGGHYLTPSGPLTNTEMDVTIQAHDGRAIHLPANFLRTVGDPGKLISQLRLRAGM